MSTTLSLIRSDPTYYVPCRPRIRITSLDGSDTYFDFNAFKSPENPINIIYVDAERAAWETGQWNVIVEDCAGEINKDHLRNCRVLIQFGKTEATLLPYMVGYADIFDIREPRGYYTEYLLSGPSSKIRAAELMLLVRKATSKINDKNFGIANLVKDMIKKRESRPLNDKDFQSITGWVADVVTEGGGIQDSLNDIYYPVVSEVFTTIWDFIERMAAVSGANWDLDYDTNFGEILMMKHSTANHSGIRVKTVNLATSTDDPRYTSYIKGGITISENSTSDAGTATRLYTSTNIEQKRVAGFSVNQNFLDLTNKAIAQQFTIQNDQRRITDLDFILSKIGLPTVEGNAMYGDIVMDVDNTPTGITIATFQIPLDSIVRTASTIFVNNLETIIGPLAGSTKIWVRLFQISGFDGLPNRNILNTIRWHNNNIFNTVQSNYTMTAIGGEYTKKDTLNWVGNDLGPLFCCGIYSKINRLQARTNQSAGKILRLKEKFLDTSFIGADFQAANRVLSLTLSKIAKTRRSVDNLQVTIPNNTLFKPFMGVSFEDAQSQTFQDLDIQRARITVSALPGEQSQIGAMHQELSLSSGFNRLTGSCECV